MDISPASVIANRQTQLQGEFATAVLKKVLDQGQTQAAQLAQMVAQAGGVGQNVDTQA
jgi:hypothetical protein